MEKDTVIDIKAGKEDKDQNIYTTNDKNSDTVDHCAYVKVVNTAKDNGTSQLFEDKKYFNNINIKIESEDENYVIDNISPESVHSVIQTKTRQTCLKYENANHEIKVPLFDLYQTQEGETNLTMFSSIA